MIINAGCTYTTASGTVVNYSEDIRWSDTHHGKFNNGMANYLDHCDGEDEWTVDVEWGVYAQRYGKRLLFTDDRGFVTCEKYPTKADAIARFEAINEAYCTWMDEEDDR